MMHKVTVKTFLLLLAVWSVQHVYAQDPIYSQYYNNPIQVNPALTGRSQGPVIGVQYRNQWPGIANTYQTYSLFYDQRLGESNSAIGGQISSDDAGGGILRTIKVAGTYAYRLTIKDGYSVNIGLETGLLHTRLDWDQLVFGDQVDPEFGILPGGARLPSTEQRPDQLGNTALDVGTGVLLSTPHYYIGLAAKHINRPISSVLNNPQNNAVNIPTRFTVHAGGEITLVRGNRTTYPTLLQPNIILLTQGAFTQVNAGANLDFGKFMTGMYYRHAGENGDAVIATIGLRYGIYKFGYSYDYTVSRLGIQTGGSHEIGVSVNLEQYGETPSRYNDCLKLFR